MDAMDAISYTAARSYLADAMEQVCDSHAPIIITRQNKRPVVLMSLDDYRAVQETAYLLRSPRNAARLSQAMADIEGRRKLRKGTFVKGTLVE